MLARQNTITSKMVGQFVDYKIRFENTGTAEVQNISLVDKIDTSKFDINSIIPVAASNPNYITKVVGNKVEFQFENINLPFDDANNDGYIVFKIKILPSLKVGDVLASKAEIYFDYNFPIVINTAEISIKETSKTYNFDNGNIFSVYPNPAKDVIYFFKSNKEKITKVEVYDLEGRLMQENQIEGNSVNLNKLQKRVYFLKVTCDGEVNKQKFIKE